MNTFNLFSNKILAFAFLLCSTLFFLNPPAEAQPKTQPTGLGIKEINQARQFILNTSNDYERRVRLAAEVVVMLEKMKQPKLARRLCLDFYGSLPDRLKQQAIEQAAPPLPAEIKTLAEKIDQGKRKSAIDDIQTYLEKSGKTDPHPAISLFSLKADNMLFCYFSLFMNFAEQKITPYAQYVIGYLNAREQHQLEATQLLSPLQGKLDDPILEGWLTFDLVKLAIVSGNSEKAEQMIDTQLEKNPNDASILYLRVLNLVTNENLSEAKRQLARLVPHLYPDPYLLADTATVALRLNELDTAAKILETYESEVEPNHEFYFSFYLLRKAQGQKNQAQEYFNKAEQMNDVRVAVAGMLPPSEELQNIITSIREKRQQEIDSLRGLDTLAKVYLYLLDYDAQSAIDLLQNLVQENPQAYAWEQYTLAAIQRRFGLREQAIHTLETLKQHHPDFRPYEILVLLSDLHYRAEQYEKAKIYYAEVNEKFPQSHQATIAKKVIDQSFKPTTASIIASLQTSTLMSRYQNYSAAYIITEIRDYWGDQVSFPIVSGQLGTSPRRGLKFDEFLAALLRGTRYRIVPFIADADVLLEFLEQKIPVVFNHGDMFANNRLDHQYLITGADPSRNVFFVDGVTPSSPHIFTQEELLEGICMAVYPNSLSPEFSEKATNSIDLGEEYTRLNLTAKRMRLEKEAEEDHFLSQLDTIKNESTTMAIPLQIAFSRWMINTADPQDTESYLSAIEPNSAHLAEYNFLAAEFNFRQSNVEKAIELLQHPLAKKPNSPRLALAKVRLLYQQNKIDDSIRLTESLRNQYPENPSVSAHLVALYEKIGEQEKKENEETRLKELLHVESIQIDLDPLDNNQLEQ